MSSLFDEDGAATRTPIDTSDEDGAATRTPIDTSDEGGDDKAAGAASRQRLASFMSVTSGSETREESSGSPQSGGPSPLDPQRQRQRRLRFPSLGDPSQQQRQPYELPCVLLPSSRRRSSSSSGASGIQQPAAAAVAGDPGSPPKDRGHAHCPSPSPCPNLSAPRGAAESASLRTFTLGSSSGTSSSGPNSLRRLMTVPYRSVDEEEEEEEQEEGSSGNGSDADTGRAHLPPPTHFGRRLCRHRHRGEARERRIVSFALDHDSVEVPRAGAAPPSPPALTSDNATLDVSCSVAIGRGVGLPFPSLRGPGWAGSEASSTSPSCTSALSEERSVIEQQQQRAAPLRFALLHWLPDAAVDTGAAAPPTSSLLSSSSALFLSPLTQPKDEEGGGVAAASMLNDAAPPPPPSPLQWDISPLARHHLPPSHPSHPSPPRRL